MLGLFVDLLGLSPFLDLPFDDPLSDFHAKMVHGDGLGTTVASYAQRVRFTAHCRMR